MGTRTVAATIAAFAVIIGGAVPVGAGEASPTVGAAPSPGSHLSSNGGHYQVELRAGQSITQSLRLVNTNGQSEPVRVTGVDALTSNTTGLAWRSPLNAQALTSRWITVATTAITMSPHETRDVAFTATVPAGAHPGQYMAGVSAWVPLASRSKPPAAGPNQATFALDVQIQRVTPIEIDVPGPRAPQLVVTGAEPQATAGGILLGVHMANQGNAFAHGSGVIRVPDTKTDFSFKIDTFLSETSIVYPMPWTASVPSGRHHVEVDLNYDGGRHLTWNGTVDVSGAFASGLQQQLQQLHVPSKGGGINWLLIAALLLLVALIVGAVLLRRRSHRPRQVKYRAA